MTEFKNREEWDNFMDKNQLIKFPFSFWREHPDWFIEEFFNIKLFNYQRILLNNILNEKNIYIIIRRKS